MKCPACNRAIPTKFPYCSYCGAPVGLSSHPTTQGQVAYAPSSHRASRVSVKNWGLALFLSIVLGMWGIDRFYLGDFVGGILKIAVTIGSVILVDVTKLWPFYLPYFAWWIIDIVLIATRRL